MKKELLAITTSTGFILVEKSAILYCLSDGSYAHIHLEDGQKLTVSKNLKEVEALLADDCFFRIHHSHLVNLNHVISYLNISHNCVQMRNGEELGVARNRKKAFLELFTRI